MKNIDNRPAIMERKDVAYEPRDVNPRSLSIVGISLLIAAVAVHFGSLLMFRYEASLDKQKGLHASAQVRSDSMTKPPEPRLQVDPAEDLNAMRAREANVLHSYAWVDQPAGVVRIPIDEAMKLLVQRQGKQQR